MKIEVFLLLLLAVSIFTSLTVEGIKKTFGTKMKFSSNVLAGVVAIVLSIIFGVCYCILMGVVFSPVIVIYILALMFLGWLSAMIGYDKVIQALAQLKLIKQ